LEFGINVDFREIDLELRKWKKTGPELYPATDSGISSVESSDPLLSRNEYVWWIGNFVHEYCGCIRISKKRLFDMETMQPANQAHLCIRLNICTVVSSAASRARGMQETDESC
jgi:hypothetical protein